MKQRFKIPLLLSALLVLGCIPVRPPAVIEISEQSVTIRGDIDAKRDQDMLIKSMADSACDKFDKQAEFINSYKPTDPYQGFYSLNYLYACK